MSDLVAARLEMALSLAFHIVFAAFGIAMPLFMFVAEAFHLRTGEPSYVALTKRWAKGTAIFFAVGAVSGTVLSFELGLLWPGFMGGFGSVIGLPFALEGFAFFTEAIFLGIYLYGWDRVSPRLHCAAGAIVALSGLASAAFVVMANSWMNTPAGFRLDEAGKVADVDPVAACLNPAALHEIVHVLLSSYCACGFAVAGVNAWIVRRDPANALAKRALQIAFGIGGGAAILLPLSGHYSAQKVAVLEPAKLAALEGQFATEKGAPLRIGGFPDVKARVTRYAIEIPKGLSFLATFDPDAEIKGLDAFAPDEPDPRIVHPAFQLMVGLGTWLAALAAGAVFLRLWKKKDPWQVPPLLLALALSTPLGFAALEAGWVVTEAGRQPWIVKGVMRTKDAVTSVQGLPLELVLFVMVYVVLAFVVYKLGRWNLDHHHA